MDYSLIMLEELQKLENLSEDYKGELKFLSKKIRKDFWNTDYNTEKLAKLLHIINGTYEMVFNYIGYFELSCIIEYVKLLAKYCCVICPDLNADYYNQLIDDIHMENARIIIEEQWKDITASEDGLKSFKEIFDDVFTKCLNGNRDKFFHKLKDTDVLCRVVDDKLPINRERFIPFDKSYAYNRWNPPGKSFLYLSFGEEEKEYSSELRLSEYICLEEYRAKKGNKYYFCDFQPVTEGVIFDLSYNDVSLRKIKNMLSLISFRGKYYYRSGSTMREITGKELERALLKTQGRTWDGVPLPKLSVSDLKQDAIQLFKDKAVKRGRLTKEEVSVEDTILMDNLHLIDEDGYLIRAAMLAFYKDPEKWVTGSYIKIGYFGKSDSDLVYQDEVHGPLIEQVDKTVDLVYTKYMKALIDYEGVQRIEQFMFHKDAFREILLNAVVHKDYSSYNPIQISVYEDKIYIWNDGEMPPNLDSTDKLFMKHSSKPFNPKLANIFFKSGMIEAWGRGFEKIREACALYDGPLPEYEINEAGIMVLCKACDRYLRLLRDDGQHPDHHPNQNGQDVNKLIIDFCKDPKSVQEIMDEFDFDSRTSFRRKYLTPMLKNGVLKMTIPEKPSSKNQKYFS